MKKSFILHYDSLSVIDKMSDEQVGKLLRMMKSYHNGNEYVCDDFSVELVFEQFKNQFERDIENYNTICARNKEIADKRWGSSKDTKSTSRTSRTVTIPESTRSTHNDNDNDSDSDNKNDNENINNNITPSGDGESVSKKVSKNKKDIFTKEEEVLFNQFWDKYPRKDAKGGAKYPFKRALELTSFETIMSALDKFKQNLYKEKTERKYMPLPSTRLNQERWEDEIIDSVQEAKKRDLERFTQKQQTTTVDPMVKKYLLDN